MIRVCALLAAAIFSSVAFSQTLDGEYQVKYMANLASDVSGLSNVINITNTGANSTVSFPTQNGNICANVYVFSPDEQLVSCCSCAVTPDGLVSLSVVNDLISNTLTPGHPTSVVVKVVGGVGPGCNAAAVGGLNVPSPGMIVWGTTIHPLPVTSGTPATTFGITETQFTPAFLSAAELIRITTLCSFIQSNGSGFGLCRACRLGGLGAVSQ